MIKIFKNSLCCRVPDRHHRIESTYMRKFTVNLTVQNTFLFFIYAASSLIKNQYTWVL